MLAAGSAISLLLTAPGMTMLANDVDVDAVAFDISLQEEFIEATDSPEESNCDFEGNLKKAESVSEEENEYSIFEDDYVVEIVGASGECGNSASWRLDDTGILYISGSGDMTNYGDADSVPWKNYRNNIKKISIGNGISSIGAYAFFGCSSLTSITFEGTSKVKDIYHDAFTNCSKLKNITLPKSVVYSKGAVIYRGCNSLESIIGYCGDNCTWEYNRSNATLTIDGNGRMHDYILQNSASTFSQNINYNDGSEAYGFTPWFSFCDEIKHVKVCGNVTYLGQGAFGSLGSEWSEGYTSLTSSRPLESVTFSSSVNEFGNKVFNFSGCSSTVEFPVTKSGVPPKTGGNFYSVKLAEGYTCTGSEWGTVLKEIYLPSTITEISSYAFNGCKNLTSIDLPSNLNKIGEGAFLGCSGLKSIIVPENVTEIVQDAFMDCTGLQKVEFKGSLETLSRREFAGCTSLKNNSIPEEFKVNRSRLLL